MAGCSTVTTTTATSRAATHYDSNAGSTTTSTTTSQYDQYNDQPNVNVDVGVSFGSFQRELAPYGNVDLQLALGRRVASRAAAGFRPYFDGYWANTREYGVMWVSNDPWDE